MAQFKQYHDRNYYPINNGEGFTPIKRSDTYHYAPSDFSGLEVASNELINHPNEAAIMELINSPYEHEEQPSNGAIPDHCTIGHETHTTNSKDLAEQALSQSSDWERVSRIFTLHIRNLARWKGGYKAEKLTMKELSDHRFNDLVRIEKVKMGKSRKYAQKMKAKYDAL